MHNTLLKTLSLFLITGCNGFGDLLETSKRDGRPAPIKSQALEASLPDEQEEEAVARPSDQVFIQTDYCICLNKKVASLGNCEQKCSDKDSPTPTLFVNTVLGPDIELNPQLGDLSSWCNNQIDDGNINPNCILEASDGLRTIPFNITIFPNTNSFSAVVNEMPTDIPLILTLKEVTSGATSRPFQLIRIEPTDPQANQRPLQIISIHLYTCVNTAGNFNENTRTYEFAIKQHFAFANNNSPPALPPSTPPPQLYCHDWFSLGATDSQAYPRLELKNQHLHLWNPNDSRFFDINQNNILDVNETIQNQLSKRSGAPVDPGLVIFSEFSWPAFPQDENGTALGYIMQAFIDENQNVFCPGQEQYENGSDVFEIIGEIVGANTEAVFVAKKEEEVFQNSNGTPIPGPNDFLLIRENDLNKIWFYFDGSGATFMADVESSKTQTIHFYWPPCEPSTGCSPTIRQANQKLYTVRSPNNIFNREEADSFGLRSTLSPADKRFGCIPRGNP